MKRRQKYEWLKLIEEWKKSGLSQAEYCRQNTLDQNLFSKQKKKVLNNGKDHGFIEVQLVDKDYESSIDLSSGNFTIKVKPDFDKVLLKQILEIIGEIRC